MSIPQAAGSEWLHLDGPPWGVRLPRSLRQGQWVPTIDERALYNSPGLDGFLYRELFKEMCFLVGNVKWCSHFRKVWWFLKKWNFLWKSYLACMHAKSLPSCLTLCNPMDCSLPGCSVCGILQARILEWVVIPSSGGSSQPRDPTQVFYISYIGRKVLYH